MSDSKDNVVLLAVLIADSASAWRSCGFHVDPFPTTTSTLSSSMSDIVSTESSKLGLSNNNDNNNSAGVVAFADGTLLILLGRPTSTLKKPNYPVVAYALSVSSITSAKHVTAHSTLSLYLLPPSSSSPVIAAAPNHPNGITCIDRLSLHSTCHRDLATSLGSLVHPSLSTARKIEDYPNNLKMGFWKLGTPRKSAENKGGVLLEVIERRPKKEKEGNGTRTTMWGFILVARDIEETHGVVEGKGRARKLKAAGGLIRNEFERLEVRWIEQIHLSRFD